MSNEECSTFIVLVPKDPLQPIQRPFHGLPLAIDFIRPPAELLERDGGRFIEVLPIEEDAPDDRAEEAARTRTGGRGPVEKHFVERTRTSFLPQHGRIGVDV